MHFTRTRDLLLSGVVALAVGLAIFDLAYGSMESIPRFAGGMLLILGLLELIGGFVVRDRIQTGRMTEAIVVSRVVIIAKASSQLGVIMLGGWLGALLYLGAHSTTLIAAKEDIPSAVIGAICAAALLAAAVWLEYCCRTPRDRDRDDGEIRRK